MRLTRDQILDSPPLLKEVEIPEWGGSVYVRSLTLAEQGKLADVRARFEKSSFGDQIKNGLLAIVQWAVCDERGERLFSSEDVAKLLNKGASPFYKLQDEILAISGLTPESREQLEKNLPTLLPAKPDSQ